MHLKNQWEKLVTRKGDFWRNYLMIASLLSLKREFGFTLPEHLTARRGNVFVHWKKHSATEQFGKNLIQLINRERNFARQIKAEAKRRIKRLTAAAYQLTKTILNQPKIAARRWKKFTDLYLNTYPIFHLTIYTDFIEQYLELPCINHNSLTKNLRRYINTAAILRLKIRKSFNVVNKKAEEFLTISAARNHLNPAVLKLLTTEELLIFFNTGALPKQSVIDSRRKYCLLYFNGKQYKILTGPAAKLLKRKIITPRYRHKMRYLHGTVVYPGKISGLARVVKSLPDAKKIKPGDILITPMTTPNLAGLIRQVAAIVTDEGGLTCHAAIIARELKKPCLVGTKIATAVIPPGKPVTVYANQQHKVAW